MARTPNPSPPPESRAPIPKRDTVTPAPGIAGGRQLQGRVPVEANRDSDLEGIAAEAESKRLAPAHCELAAR